MSAHSAALFVHLLVLQILVPLALCGHNKRAAERTTTGIVYRDDHEIATKEPPRDAILPVTLQLIIQVYLRPESSLSTSDPVPYPAVL